VCVRPLWSCHHHHPLTHFWADCRAYRRPGATYGHPHDTLTARQVDHIVSRTIVDKGQTFDSDALTALAPALAPTLTPALAPAKQCSVLYTNMAAAGQGQSQFLEVPDVNTIKNLVPSAKVGSTNTFHFHSVSSSSLHVGTNIGAVLNHKPEECCARSL